MTVSPLHAVHQRLGARFVDFAGWEMPVQYRGVIAEHRAVRSGVGAFDVSHLGRLRVEGEGATVLLGRLLCNDAAKIGPGRAQYTMMLNRNGGVEDDIIVWRLAEEHYWVLPNAANYHKVMEAFRDHAPEGVGVEGLRETTAFLAVQGPEGPRALEGVLGRAPGRFRVARATFAGGEVWTAGTGYTGERGGEVAVPAERAAELFQALLAEGAVPCGLGARDTLRLEMGYPLWGQDLDPETTPLEADLGWVVDWNHDFVGKHPLEVQRAQGMSKLLVGFVMAGREIARHGYPARAGGSSGTVASGNYSPTLGRGIGMAFLAPPPPDDLDELDELEVEVRGRWVPAGRRKPPFIKS